MASAATAQINVRLPAGLKEQGDRGLREIGLSTTEAIRTLWNALATRGEAFDRARSLLLGETEELGEASLAVDGPLERGWAFVEAHVRELGLAGTPTAVGSVNTDEELLAEALGERMIERGVC